MTFRSDFENEPGHGQWPGCEAMWGLLSAYADGEAAPDESRRVERHVAVCPGCADSLAFMRQERQAVRSLPVAPPPPELRAAILAATVGTRRRPDLWRRLAAPLGAAAAAGLLAVTLLPRTPAPAPSAPPAVRLADRPQPAGSEAPPAAATEAPPPAPQELAAGPAAEKDGKPGARPGTTVRAPSSRQRIALAARPSAPPQSAPVRPAAPPAVSPTVVRGEPEPRPLEVAAAPSRPVEPAVPGRTESEASPLPDPQLVAEAAQSQADRALDTFRNALLEQRDALSQAGEPEVLRRKREGFAPVVVIRF